MTHCRPNLHQLTPLVHAGSFDSWSPIFSIPVPVYASAGDRPTGEVDQWFIDDNITRHTHTRHYHAPPLSTEGGSVAEQLACWTQAFIHSFIHSYSFIANCQTAVVHKNKRRRRALVQIAAAMRLGNSLRQTVNTNRASVHQAAKLVAALLRFAGVTAGLAESNGSLPPGL